ncbi:DUF3179 domain-containing protein [Haloplanus aerogenes]|uniref:DUF3179 domain-containing protein n=1 Tax=Haloplanus aerogenes TaxID=660522 RepID=A0A3M0DI48_9EURY|nr:DUF3179 domain-containing protein [Haloplanus aerogenes]AZH26121.1 DUF3179 domain-containing protein [Haloplanus aerogenes]RMB18426.1 uncharacterized protein DUF3179 [Haloplanus aerogenes]
MRTRHTRRAAVALGVGAVGALAGCLGGNSVVDAGGGDDGHDDGTETPSADGPPPADRSPLVAYDASRLRAATVSGGPPKDGIPSVDEPSVVDASAAAFLRDEEIVVGVARGEAVRAYPRKILVHHEIVNDRLDGVPVSVTYCPLTGTVLGFERGATTFGVSGNLVNSNLVMYDRATDSRWPQVLATAIDGPLTGRSLREFDVVWTTWRQWRARYPETEVLSEDTGYVRNYGVDPYGSYGPKRGYYARQSTMFEPLTTDDRLQPKTTVLGVRTGAGATAVQSSWLAREGVVDAAVGDERFAFVHDPALDSGFAYRVPADVPVAADGEDDRIRVDGDPHAPDALPFERAHGIEAMWFAWAGFYPETDLHAYP